jgi:hypothetical protein
MNSATSPARIPDPAAGVTFQQIWKAESAEAQDGWLRDMRANIDLLRVKSGFISMALHFWHEARGDAQMKERSR